MNHRLLPLQRCLGAALATVATVAVVGSVDRLSTRPAAEMQLAKRAAATRVVATDAPARPPAVTPGDRAAPRTGAGGAAAAAT